MTQGNIADALAVAPDLRLPAVFGDHDVAQSLVLADEAALWRATAKHLSGRSPQERLLLPVVVGCAAWDSLLRERQVFPSSVYFASSAAVAQLARVVEPELNGPTLVDDVDALLGSLFTAELVYRFPVALKFRGRFGPERQVRLNCWGRRLAARIADEPNHHTRAAIVGDRLRLHFEHFESAYRSHMRDIAQADALPPGAAWESATALPIGLLW